MGGVYFWLALGLAGYVEEMRDFQGDIAGNLMARRYWLGCLGNAIGICDEMNEWTSGRKWE